MKKLSLIILLIISILQLQAQNEVPLTQVKDQAQITPEEVYEHIKFLASDSLKGRFPGTPESKVAANYILTDFKKSGLKPMFNNGFQTFEIPIKRKISSIRLKIDDFSCKYTEEYIPLMFSPTGNFTGKAVFAGYGFDLSDSTFKWNDYENLDVKGKWVVIFRGKPDVTGFPETFFDNDKEYDKVLTAADKGAIGVIFVNTEKYKNDELPQPCFGRVGKLSAIPAIAVKRFTGERLFKKANKNLSDIENQINRLNKPVNFEINTTITAKLDIEPVKIQTQNVVAILEGSDPNLKDEYIVIGAHYDHLGYGGCGSGSRMPDTIAVHNGADDNASGDAGLLELAEYLAANKDKIGRSIIFVAFGAEERGLLGSKYFIEHLPVDKDNIYAMLNMDMIGKSTGKLSVLGTGTGDNWENILNEIKYDTTQMKVEFTKNAFSGSDHASFYNAKIPVLFFYASSGKGYHTPFDDYDKINAQGEADVLKYIAQVAIKLSECPKGMYFQEVASKNSDNHSYGTRVKLGIVPTFEDTGNKGMKISGVTEDSPAEKAGLQANDIITGINNETVNNIYDYMNRMQKLKPGQKITVQINRNGENLNFEIQL